MLAFYTDPPAAECYTLSLHDALPILGVVYEGRQPVIGKRVAVKFLLPSLSKDKELVERFKAEAKTIKDRKSTRLNSSHTVISYAVFCLKKKKIKDRISDLLGRASERV